MFFNLQFRSTAECRDSENAFPSRTRGPKGRLRASNTMSNSAK